MKQSSFRAASACVAAAVLTANAYAVTDNSFNPAISIILDGSYSNYEGDPEDYVLSGFALGGEAELAASGFALGHSELTLSNNIDDKFFGQFTVAFAEHEGELEVELEEAFIETIGLGGGFTVRGGRFFSGIGYLNQQHEHAWDFQDAPLIYRGLFGGNYLDDGLQFSYVAPTDVFFEVGIELFAGNNFPAGGERETAGVTTLFANIGGDIDDSNSWLVGASLWSGSDIEREYNADAHGGAVETPVFEGDSDIVGVYGVYKWAPNGNVREQHVKLQFEYFDRDEDGTITLLDSGPPVETSTLDSQQDGWYFQAVWGFAPSWRTGIRYDSLSSDNTGSDVATLDEAGLVSNGHDPERISAMVEWVPSEFSRVRLQVNRDESSPVTDDQIFVQYTTSIGAHGAHSY